MQLHIIQFPPTKAWPLGGWSVYVITGDQIAKRVQFGPDGEVIQRDTWCGFLGCYATLSEAVEAIEEHKAREAA